MRSVYSGTIRAYFVIIPCIEEEIGKNHAVEKSSGPMLRWAHTALKYDRIARETAEIDAGYLREQQKTVQ